MRRFNSLFFQDVDDTVTERLGKTQSDTAVGAECPRNRYGSNVKGMLLYRLFGFYYLVVGMECGKAGW